MSVLYGVAAALLIGVSDTFGSQSSRRSTALQSVTAAFWTAGLLGLLIAPLTGDPLSEDLLRGALSGVAAAAALSILWHAYTLSTVGVAAPAAAVVGGALPVLIDTLRGDEPGTLGIVGVGVGLSALVLTTWSTDGRPVAPGLTLGAVAGMFFATAFVISAETSVDSGIWPMASQRIVAALIVTGAALSRGLPPLAPLRDARLGVLGGIAGGAAVSAVILGGQRHPLGPITVAASQYPAVVVALHWIFFGERMRWWQVVGLAGALVGVGLLAAD